MFFSVEKTMKTTIIRRPLRGLQGKNRLSAGFGGLYARSATNCWYPDNNEIVG
jgi:hypothetical protein